MAEKKSRLCVVVSIPLVGKHGLGKHAIIDRRFAGDAAKYKWHWSAGYAKAHVYVGERKKKKIALHQFIVGLAGMAKPPEKDTIDHINRNKLDNTIGNLRWATCSEQCINTTRRSGALGMRNIYQRHGVKGDTYEVKLIRAGEAIKVGTYVTLEEASAARNAWYLAH